MALEDPDAGRDWGQEEKGTTEAEMVGWHHRLSGHEFEQAPGVGDGQGSLACCCPLGTRRERGRGGANPGGAGPRAKQTLLRAAQEESGPPPGLTGWLWG